MRISALLFAAALALVPLATAHAGFSPSGNATQSNPYSGGFTGPGSVNVNRAADVEKAYDDAIAVLEGNLVEQVGSDLYIFKDSSGTVLVEIDHEDFYGASVNPQTRVRIMGEVDKEAFERTKVDVKRLEVIK